MKTKYYLFALSFFICSFLCEKSSAQSSDNNYIVLRSGEKINNISGDQWKQLNKKGKMEISGRTILNDSIDHYVKEGDNYIVVPKGGPEKQVIAGKISVYGSTLATTYKSFSTGTKNVGRTGVYWMKKGNEPIKFMDWASLQEILADNPEAVEKVIKLQRNIIKNKNPKNQLDIIRFYNGEK